ncbi:MAG: cobalamin biosynthesis bifunctional protein CbiET [Sneathiella sp.]|nr:MAG: cobalamin biosynthesis bifunctional protein CbiET [Sneathiella sp.]
MTAWLSIVGLGEDGLAALSAPAKAAIDNATLLVGGERHLAMLPDDGRMRKTWTSPLMDLVHEIIDRRGEKICVLATGDPMQYGIGVTFAKRLAVEEMAIFPALSAFSLAAARLGWDLSTTETLTLHGRPLSLLIPHLTPGAKLLALSDSRQTPADVATLLTYHGFGGSELTVLEHMGGAKEIITKTQAKDFAMDRCRDLNTLAILCVADLDARILSTAPGLPDDAFTHDGQLTKQEIRSATLSALMPLPGQLLWDVGAGCGSVGIEWMRCHRGNKAIAIESHVGRIKFIQQNRERLGAPSLQVVEGKAPDSLKGITAPDAVFIGGGLTQSEIFGTCWSALKSGGRLVANAVTMEGEARLFELHKEYGGSLTRLNISRAGDIGGFTGWKPFRQVTQIRLVKE